MTVTKRRPTTPRTDMDAWRIAVFVASEDAVHTKLGWTISGEYLENGCYYCCMSNSEFAAAFGCDVGEVREQLGAMERDGLVAITGDAKRRKVRPTLPTK